MVSVAELYKCLACTYACCVQGSMAMLTEDSGWTQHGPSAH